MIRVIRQDINKSATRGFVKAIVTIAKNLLTIVLLYVRNGWYFTNVVTNIGEIRPIVKIILGAI